MNSKIEEQMLDSTMLSNNINQDIVSVENRFVTELTSEDLFKIDCAILSTLKETKDFSRDLLRQLENGCFETTMIQKTTEDEFTRIQQEAIMDVTLPLQNMFDEMTDFVVEAFI